MFSMLSLFSFSAQTNGEPIRVALSPNIHPCSTSALSMDCLMSSILFSKIYKAMSESLNQSHPYNILFLQ